MSSSENNLKRKLQEEFIKCLTAFEGVRFVCICFYICYILCIYLYRCSVDKCSLRIVQQRYCLQTALCHIAFCEKPYCFFFPKGIIGRFQGLHSSSQSALLLFQRISFVLFLKVFIFFSKGLIAFL